jgi:hypothetical protein
MEDKNVDSIILLSPLVTNTSNLNQSAGREQYQISQSEHQQKLNALSRMIKQYGKPLLTINRFMGNPDMNAAAPNYQSEVRLLGYPTPRRAARVLRQLNWYRDYIDRRKA